MSTEATLPVPLWLYSPSLLFSRRHFILLLCYFCILLFVSRWPEYIFIEAIFFRYVDIFLNSLFSGVTVFFSLGLENIYSFLFRATRSHARTKIKMPKFEQGRLCYMRDFCIFCFLSLLSFAGLKSVGRDMYFHAQIRIHWYFNLEANESWWVVRSLSIKSDQTKQTQSWWSSSSLGK